MSRDPSDVPESGNAEPRTDGGTEDDEYGYDTWEVLVSVAVAVGVGALVYWWITSTFEVFHENLYRVQPTVEDRGVGADWVVGNTEPWMDFLVAFVHAADVIMGVFILLMVFLHWAAFRRLATRMRDPERADVDEVVADGGERPGSEGGDRP